MVGMTSNSTGLSCLTFLQFVLQNAASIPSIPANVMNYANH